MLLKTVTVWRWSWLWNLATTSLVIFTATRDSNRKQLSYWTSCEHGSRMLLLSGLVTFSHRLMILTHHLGEWGECQHVTDDSFHQTYWIYWLLSVICCFCTYVCFYISLTLLIGKLTFKNPSLAVEKISLLIFSVSGLTCGDQLVVVAIELSAADNKLVEDIRPACHSWYVVPVVANTTATCFGQYLFWLVFVVSGTCPVAGTHHVAITHCGR